MFSTIDLVCTIYYCSDTTITVYRAIAYLRFPSRVGISLTVTASLVKMVSNRRFSLIFFYFFLKIPNLRIFPQKSNVGYSFSAFTAFQIAERR